jgi:hypothetical protein
MAANIEELLIDKFRTLPLDKQEEAMEYVNGLLAEQPSRTETEPIVRRTIWEMVRDRIEALPPEAFDGIPTDGSLNVDHYLYGAPKKTE